MRQWKHRKACPTCRICEVVLDDENWLPSHRRRFSYACTPCNRVLAREHSTKNLATTLLISARNRARTLGLPFDITADDIIIPAVCPVLGIPLRRATGMGGNANSPSLDRIIPERGYVRGNIVVMSKRANTAKSNLTGEELLRLAAAVLYGFDASRVDNPLNRGG